MNKKTLVKIAIALTLGLLLFLIVNHFNQLDYIEGQKEITLIIALETDEADEIIVELSVLTYALTLGELLDELNANDVLAVEFDTTSFLGRSIISINDFTTYDWASGPWWVFNSINNASCLDAGFCAGIDQTPIDDGDQFIFIFIASFE